MNRADSVIAKDNIKEIKELLEKYSDSSGRVECRKALAVARKLNISPLVVGKVATEEGYRIFQCELGQFGDKKIGEFNIEVYSFLKNFADEKGRITCKNACRVATKFGLYKVRSTIKNSDLEVVDCQLGCFYRKKKARLKIYVELKLESKNSGKVLSKEDFELLELIKHSNNLCEVISEINISFLELKEKIDILEKSLGVKCIKSGYNYQERVLLTDEALTLIGKFKKLQEDVNAFALKRFRELFYGDRVYRKT